jgi:sRNA-binding carbon storage regulator CsrA
MLIGAGRPPHHNPDIIGLVDIVLLILSRNIGESIIIGDLCVTVTGVFNKKVQLGIVNQREKSGFSTLEGKLETVITIPENVKIKIIQIRGRQVRIGIKAPPGILVLRDNLAEKK